MRLRYVLLLLLLLAGCGSEPEPAQPSSPRLYLPGDGELWVVDVAEQSVRHVTMEELHPGDPPHRVIARGDRLVLVGAPPFAVDGDLATHQVLVPDAGFALPSAHADRVWAVRLGREGIDSVVEVTVDGTVTVPPARPPGGRWPLAAVRDGLLVEDFDGGILVWDPAADAVVRRIAIDPGGFGTASGDLITSCGDPCMRLRLTDTRTGASSEVEAPDGLQFEPWHAAFSTDGTRLGIAVTSSGHWRAPRRLALVDLESGEAEVVPRSSVPGGYTFVVWGRDHVFITGGEGFEPRTLVAYRLGDRRAHRIDVAVGDFYGAAAL